MRAQATLAQEQSGEINLIFHLFDAVPDTGALEEFRSPSSSSSAAAGEQSANRDE